MLVAAREIHEPACDRIRREIEVARVVAALMVASAHRLQRHVGLRAAVQVRGRVARAQRVSLPPILESEGGADRRCEPDVERAHKVEVVGPLRVLVGGDVKGRGGAAVDRVPAGIGRIDQPEAIIVASVGRAQIPVPAEELRALDAPSRREIVLLDRLLRRESVRVYLREDAREPIVLVGLRVAVCIGAEAVELDGPVGEGFAGVVADRGPRGLRIAEDRIVIEARAAVGTRADAVVVVTVVDAQVEEPVLAQRGPEVSRSAAREAVTMIILAGRSLDVAAVVLRLEDDVDDTRDRIATVLGGGAVLQHLDVIDRAERDQIEIDRRGALLRSLIQNDVRRSMTAFAVDQHQHVIGAQAAQLNGIGQGAEIPAERRTIE